jgi:hypothetical protein
MQLRKRHKQDFLLFLINPSKLLRNTRLTFHPGSIGTPRSIAWHPMNVNDMAPTNILLWLSSLSPPRAMSDSQSTLGSFNSMLQLMQMSNLAAIHAKRVTLMTKDMQFVRRVFGVHDAGIWFAKDSQSAHVGQ